MSGRKVARFELVEPDKKWKDLFGEMFDEPVWEGLPMKIMMEPIFGGIVWEPPETVELKERIYKHLREIEELIPETYEHEINKDCGEVVENLSPIFGSSEVKL